MKTFLAAAFAAVAAADVMTIPATAITDEAKAACNTESVAALSPTDKALYDKAIAKINAGFNAAANEQAAKQKVDDANAACETKWLESNGKSTTAEEGDQIEAKAKSLLTAEQQTALDEYDAAIAAGTEPTQAQKDAQTAYLLKKGEQLTAWGAGTFEPLASDAAIAVGAAGALLAAVALF